MLCCLLTSTSSGRSEVNCLKSFIAMIMMDAQRRGTCRSRLSSRGFNFGIVLELVIAATLVAHACAHGRQNEYRGRFMAQPRLRRSGSDTTGRQPTMGDGTTDNLQEIFSGRCFDYTCDFCSVGASSPYNCSEIWKSFNITVSYRVKCTTPPEDFDEFVSLTYIEVPIHKSLFYSGTYEIATTVGNNNAEYVNLESTLIGTVADQLVFCGQTASPGFNYDVCPTYAGCANETRSSYWKRVSREFASTATGDVTVILDGSREDGAYRNSSTFRSVEVVYMDPNKVTSLTAFIVHSLDGTVFESCVTGTLLELERDMQEKGIKFKCLDDPSVTRSAQCLIEKDHPACTACSSATMQTSALSLAVLIPLLTMLIFNHL